MASSRKDFLTLARARFKLAEEADKNQRQRERDDLRMYAGDQWPADVMQNRKGQDATQGMPSVPARPIITINKVRQPVRQVLNQERQADLGVSLVPADDFGGQTGTIDETEIELREGLLRRIQRHSQAADARTWAFARAVTAGRGYYGVMTRYVDVPFDAEQPGPAANDQEIYIQRFYNQFSVTLDPAHEQPDGSDAEWGFIWQDMTSDEYKKRFKRRNGKTNNLAGDLNDDEWRALGDEAPAWFTSDNDTRFFRVGDYYYTELTSRTLVTLPDGQTAWEDTLPDGWHDKLPQDFEPFSRDVLEKQIKWAKIDGSSDDVLEETDWPGQFIPIIKVIGEELQPYDKERRAEGMVRPAADSQRAFNYMVAKEVEVIGLSPIPPLMVAEGQDEGYEAWYEALNTRTLYKLPYRTRDLQGNPIPPPTYPPNNTSALIGPISAAIQLFSEGIKDTTQVPDATLGNVDPTLRSGRAIKTLLAQAQQGTSHYLDNLMRSLTYEARIINDLLYPIYGTRPGRLIHLMTGEDEHKPVLLKTPFTMQGKRPVPVNGQPPTGMNGNGAKIYQLTKDATFNIAIKVGKSFNTRRDEESTQMGELISANPGFMSWFGDLFFANQDGPGHQQMAERAKAMLAPPIQQLLQKDEQQPQIPPQVQQQMQQAQQAIQMLSAELQKKTQIIETDQVKQQAETDRLKLKIQADVYMKELDVRAKLADSQTKIDAARADLAIEQEQAQLEQGHEQAHEAGLQAADQVHQQQMAQLAHAQQLQQADQGHQQALEQGQQAGQQQADLQAQQAASQPQEPQ